MSTSTISVAPAAPILPSYRKTAARVALFDLSELSYALLAECFRQFGVETIRLPRKHVERLQKEKFEACVLPLGDSAGSISKRPGDRAPTAEL